MLLSSKWLGHQTFNLGYREVACGFDPRREY